MWQRLQLPAGGCYVRAVGEIVLDHVTKDFGNGVLAVNDVNLAIGEGEFMVLVGPSGCGKTTLLRSIGGLERITGGRVLLRERGGARPRPAQGGPAPGLPNHALFPPLTRPN